MNIIYIHGFRSSGDSEKAKQLRIAFPDCNVISPTLSARPSAAIKELQSVIAKDINHTIVVGTSLGGFYAACLACIYNIPAFIINPALEPHISLAKGIGCFKRYDTEEDYEFKTEYLIELDDLFNEMNKSRKNKDNFNFYLSADDEVLTYEKLNQFFPEKRTIKIFENSGHRFTRFTEIIPDIKIVVIKNKISLLAQKHSSDVTEEWDTEILEDDAQNLIIDYCKQNNYKFQGFPDISRRLTEEEIIAADGNEEYFTKERYQLFLDNLLLLKDDVAELMWHYVSSFWADTFDCKEDYIESVKEQITCGNFYEVSF